MISVDLRTRILPADHNVFMTRPGRGYRLFNDFVGNRAIGPELPGIKLVPGTDISDQPDLDNKLKLTAAIRRWARQGASDNAIPSENSNEYQAEARTKSGPQFKAALRGYFEIAKKGDLILIPPSQYRKDAVLAELTEGPENIHYIKIPDAYGNFELPTRKFKELQRIARKDLPVEILAVIEKPNSIVSIAKSLRNFVYDNAYGNYSVEGSFNSRFDVTTEFYDSDADFFLFAFIKFVAENTKRVTIEPGQPILSIEEAAFESLGEFALSLKTNVNSPGHFGFKSQYVTPLVAAAMFALAMTVGEEASAAAKNGTLIIGNSSAPAGDQCTASVEESTLDQMKLFEFEEWARACEIARKAAKDTGLKAGPIVKEKKGG